MAIEFENAALPLVPLDQDHPGFRDVEYRRRRNEIAAQAMRHRVGSEPLPVEYTSDEHDVWRIALESLAPLHIRYGISEFHRGWQQLGFASDQVPQLADVNRLLTKTTGFEFVPVAGLVEPRVFLAHLAERRFLSTQYMRHHSAPLYTPEPDVIHELVGHAPLLMDEKFAALNHRFGLASLRASEARMTQLIRLYWHSLEFGLARNEGNLHAIGAGLYSSFGELGRLAEGVATRAFTADDAALCSFDPTRYQDALFVADSQSAMVAQIDAFLSA